MRVTVIFEDSVIIVDNVAKRPFDFSAVDPNWHALQWGGEEGWIEVKQGDRLWLDTDEKVVPFVTMFNTIPDAEPAPATPSAVTSLQVRLLLLQQGLLDQVETMIKAQDRATQITWEFASEFRRDDPLLDKLATNLDLTQPQIDQFFIAAAAL